MSDAPDLLAALLTPEERAGLPTGAVRGEVEGLGAGLDIWCGPHLGWRQVGEIVNSDRVTLLRHRGRVFGSFTFDLGAAPLVRVDDEAEAA
jgi:hypothetical protein